MASKGTIICGHVYEGNWVNRLLKFIRLIMFILLKIMQTGFMGFCDTAGHWFWIRNALGSFVGSFISSQLNRLSEAVYRTKFSLILFPNHANRSYYNIHVILINDSLNNIYYRAEVNRSFFLSNSLRIHQLTVVVNINLNTKWSLYTALILHRKPIRYV